MILQENMVFNPKTTNLTSFPRLTTTPQLPLKAQHLKLSVLQGPLALKKSKQNLVSHKSLLHYHNAVETNY